MELKKNDCISLEITGMSAQGAGVGKHEGMAIFVPLSAPGDKLRVHIVQVRKNYAFGKIQSIITPSSHRIPADCSCYAQCGGCCYRHITYEAELSVKTQRVRDALERIGGLENPPLSPILAADSRDQYRNKALLPLGKNREGQLIMGFYAVNSHRIVDCTQCKLQPEVFNQAMTLFRRWAENTAVPIYDEATHEGSLRRLYLRWGEKSGELMVCPVINGNQLQEAEDLVLELREAFPSLASVAVNTQRERTNVALGEKTRTLWGKDTIEDTLCELRFQISPLSFYQVNRTQAERLYEKAGEYANLLPTETLLDLYCGTGTIGLSMAHRAKQVIGVEIIPAAVENARENAENNGIPNAEFICGDAAQAAQELKKRGLHPDVVLVDPPRKGCEEALIHTICTLSPSRIIYISCDPATLARDLKTFASLGYSLTQITPVDMFPATAHVECVAKLCPTNR